MKKTILYTSTLALALIFAACAAENPVSSGNETPTNTSSTSSSATTTSSSTTATSAATEIPTFKVTVEDAIQAYQETHPNTDITSIELDSSLGNYFYKVEGVDDDNEYEVSVDAQTKEVKKQKEEALDADEQKGVKRQEDKLDLSDLLTVEEAAKIATDEAKSGQVTDWDLDKEMNITYWDVQVKDGNKETNVKLDAKTGEVLEVELDD